MITFCFFNKIKLLCNCTCFVNSIKSIKFYFFTNKSTIFLKDYIYLEFPRESTTNSWVNFFVTASCTAESCKLNLREESLLKFRLCPLGLLLRVFYCLIGSYFVNIGSCWFLLSYFILFYWIWTSSDILINYYLGIYFEGEYCLSMKSLN